MRIQVYLAKHVRSALVLVGAVVALLTSCPRPEKADYLRAAEKAAAWIQAAEVRTGQGLAWPVAPEVSSSVDAFLYSGTPGVVLFFLEAYHTTGTTEYLRQAVSGADCLLSQLSKENRPGFYTGLSGIAFALQETYKASNDERHKKGFLDCLNKISTAAVESENGIAWGPTTDIISGNAGIGLFLIYGFHETKDEIYLDLASRAGRDLVELSQPEKEGLKWAMDPEYPRLMPNFSHGTAGIAYFLASLFLETEDKPFLDAALSGAKYLVSVADKEGDICRVFHHEPGGEDLFYLGWCHGPVGTARLFFRLYEATGDESWLGWVRRSADAIVASGIPEEETPGFWNNAGICCGLAGVGEFFLDLWHVFGERKDLDFCRRITAKLLEKASEDNGKMFWSQAEHRTRPDYLMAQTGYMQGAAGIGMFLLHLHAADEGGGRIFLPDTPFRR